MVLGGRACTRTVGHLNDLGAVLAVESRELLLRLVGRSAHGAAMEHLLRAKRHALLTRHERLVTLCGDAAREQEEAGDLHGGHCLCKHSALGRSVVHRGSFNTHMSQSAW